MAWRHKAKAGVSLFLETNTMKSPEKHLLVVQEMIRGGGENRVKIGLQLWEKVH